MRLVLVVWLLVSSVAGEEWYMTNWVDCFAALSVESKASGSEITRAVRRVTSLNHPDRCKTPECAVRFADANSCKETLLDPKKRASYEEILAQGGPRIAPIGPPKVRCAARPFFCCVVLCMPFIPSPSPVFVFLFSFLFFFCSSLILLLPRRVPCSF